MTTLATLMESALKEYHDEYVEFCKKWILKRNAEYEEATTRLDKLAPNVKPIRRVDEQYPTHTIVWHWSEAIWCGDVCTSSCPEEFFSVKEPELWEWMDMQMMDGESDTATSLIAMFDEAFRAVMPTELHHVLEA